VGCRRGLVGIYTVMIKPFKAELNPIRHLPELLEAHLILHVSRIRVNIYAYAPMSTRNLYNFKQAQFPNEVTQCKEYFEYIKVKLKVYIYLLFIL